MKEYRISGVLKGKSQIAYAFDLPKIENEETTAFLEALADRFLFFLNKESEKPCDILRFGGIRFEEEEGKLRLFAAFGPFEARSYFPKATLTLDQEGNVLRIKKEKRSR